MRDLLNSEIVSKEHAAIIITVMWAIWSSRNKYTHEEVGYQPHKSMELVDELIKSLHIPDAPVDAKQKPRWSPSEPGWVKFNTDAAINLVVGEAGTGMAGRDTMGTFYGSKFLPSMDL